MDYFICTTCGTQFDASDAPPEQCAICQDERQYINPNGQQWTTLKKLRNNHRVVVQKKEYHLYGIGMTPEFGIGQRALLLITPKGNILWDCIPLIDGAIVDIVQSLGGLDAIAISHPHYYTSMIEWSRRFNDVPVFLHRKDREWVQRNHNNIHYWEGTSKELFDGITLYNLGGHFDGGSILHWPHGAGGIGALLAGDILQVVPDRKHVSFMYSYPNLIPLNASTVHGIVSILEPLNFDRIYGAWWDLNILKKGKQVVQESAKRYVERLKK